MRILAAVTLALLLVAVVAAQAAQAAKWEPYKFKGNEKYEFKITYTQDGKPAEAYYAIDIRATGKKNADGEALFEITSTSQSPATKLGAETMLGPWSFSGGLISMLFLNPAHAYMFTQLDLAPGKKMDYRGTGVVKVTKKETIGGREGLICQLYASEDEGGALLTEWTIDPALALPIKSFLYENGKVTDRIELVKYATY